MRFIILGTIIWCVLYHVVKAFWGLKGQVAFLGFGVAVWIGASIYIARVRRQIEDECEPEEAEALLAELEEPDLQGLRLRTPQKIVDAVLAIAFFVVPPVLVSFFRDEPLSWDSPFTIWHLGAMLGGVASYIVLRPRVFGSCR